jgi:hypothetical protein
MSGQEDTRVDVAVLRNPSVIVPYSVPEHVKVSPEALAALLDVAEAAREASRWMLLPSDVYAHQVERLGEVRLGLSKALDRLYFGGA